MSFVANSTAPLLDVLETLFPDSSKNTLKKWVRSKRVSVDGLVVDNQTIAINKGSKITLGSTKEYYKQNVEILYEDQDLVVIYKPEGLLSVATEKESYRTAHDLLKTRSPKKRVFPVHRLDRDTSGVMVFAYSNYSKEHLKKQFENHTIHREYRAILLGHLEEKKGTWQSYLIEDGVYKVHECEKKEGAQLAISEFEVLKESKKCSFVKFVLRTGKKNQIRVQSAQRGHPVLGDKKYGTMDISFPRLSLHAYILEFTHPSKEKKMNFSYPIPKEFNKVFPQK